MAVAGQAFHTKDGPGNIIVKEMAKTVAEVAVKDAEQNAALTFRPKAVEPVGKHKDTVSDSQRIFLLFHGDGQRTLQHHDKLRLAVEMRGIGVVIRGVKAYVFRPALIKNTHGTSPFCAENRCLRFFCLRG